MTSCNKLIKIVVLIIAILSVGACQKDEKITAPWGTTVVAYPDSYSDTTGGSSTYAAIFTIIVFDGNGNPMNNVEITVRSSKAGDGSDELWFMSEEGDPLIGTLRTSFIKRYTDEAGGFQLNVGYQKGVAISTEIEIISGSAEHIFIPFSAT